MEKFKTNRQAIIHKAKTSIMLIFVAAVLIEVINIGQFFYTRYTIKEQSTKQIYNDMHEIQRVVNLKTSVETAVQNAMGDVEISLDDPNQLYGIATRLVLRNPEISSSAELYPRPIPNFALRPKSEPYILSAADNAVRGKLHVVCVLDISLAGILVKGHAGYKCAAGRMGNSQHFKVTLQEACFTGRTVLHYVCKIQLYLLSKYHHGEIRLVHLRLGAFRERHAHGIGLAHGNH